MAGEFPRLWIIAIVLTLLFHYVWEMGQAGLFKDFAGVSFLRHALICLLASFGDLAIAVAAYFVTAAVFRQPAWAIQDNWHWPALLWVALGLVVAVAIERWSLAERRWAYSPAMPTLFGIGVTPLLQWIVVPLATLIVFRWVAARSPPAGG